MTAAGVLVIAPEDLPVGSETGRWKTVVWTTPTLCRPRVMYVFVLVSNESLKSNNTKILQAYRIKDLKKVFLYSCTMCLCF